MMPGNMFYYTSVNIEAVDVLVPKGDLASVVTMKEINYVSITWARFLSVSRDRSLS